MARPLWRRIGECGVDSGQLYIIDPCYLRQWNHEEHYQECMDATNKAPTRGGPAFDGVAFGTAYGDGCYPVFARYEEGGIVEVRIIMDDRNYPDGSEEE